MFFQKFCDSISFNNEVLPLTPSTTHPLKFWFLFLISQRTIPLPPKLPLFDSLCQYFAAHFVLLLHLLLLKPELLYPAQLQAAHKATDFTK